MDKRILLKAIQQLEADVKVLKQLYQAEYSQEAPEAKKDRVAKIPQLVLAESLPEHELGPIPNWESDDWPEAIPEYLIVRMDAPDAEKRFRAIQIVSMLDHDLTGLRCLDLGCGTGHIAVEMASKAHSVVGYDIVPQKSWSKFQNSPVFFTSSKEDGFGEPFDFIFCYDVIDHLEREQPYEFMTWAASLLDSNGTMIVRAHPWTSRHGSHSYEVVNKAYIHLALTPQELINNEIPIDCSLRLVRPLASYEAIFKKAGLKVVNKNTATVDLEPFFDDAIIERINKINWRGNISLEITRKIMVTQFIDYQLERE